jgi:paraquat-inducible protein B
VGQVVTYTLNPEGKGVDIEVFIHAPNDAFVTENTRFWNASGIDINVGANGFAVKTESLSTMLVGGIAFRAPDYSPNDVAASEDKDFELFADQQTALARPTARRNTWCCVSSSRCAGSRSMRPSSFSAWRLAGSSESTSTSTRKNAPSRLTSGS